MNSQNLTEVNPQVCSGQEVFKGTRILVNWIAGQIKAGVSLEEIKVDYPNLTLEQLQYAEERAKILEDKPTKPLIIRRI